MGADDQVMESTTDTPEQIVEGLSDQPAAPPDGEETPASASAETPDPTPASTTDADEQEDLEPEAEPVQAAPDPKGHNRGTAPRRRARPQRKDVDGAAAAARRKAESEQDALRQENERLKQELETARRPTAKPADADTDTDPDQAVHTDPTATTTTIAPKDVPDTHPDVVAALKAVTDLGERPKQGDFEDFDAFEEAKDKWIEDRAIARAQVESVRKDVARRETARATEANRVEQQRRSAWSQTLAAAKARHADYDAAMEAANQAGLEVSNAIGAAVYDSPIGAELSYFLATNTDETKRLNGLTPSRALAELGKIEARLEAELTVTPVNTGGRSVRTTKAPDPQRNLADGLPSHTAQKDLDDPNISQAEYNKRRDAMDRASGRVTH